MADANSESFEKLYNLVDILYDNIVKTTERMVIFNAGNPDMIARWEAVRDNAISNMRAHGYQPKEEREQSKELENN